MNFPLTIVIPARREEGTILHSLEQLRKSVKTKHKIVVVNDSDYEDKTGNIVKEYIEREKLENISVLISRKNNKPTFASALILGFNVVDTGVVVVVMADLCDELNIIDKMYEEINKGWDIVCGCRYIKGGSKKGGPKIQSFFSTLICFTLHFLTGIPTKDVSNAFKMYRKDLLNNIKINPHSGVEASMEVILQAYFKGAKMKDIPTKWIGRTVGESKFKIFERSPRYLKIYLWALKSTFKMRYDSFLKFFLDKQMAE